LPWSLLESIRSDPKLDGLDDDLREIAARVLAFNAGDRFASVEDLRLAIADAHRRRPLTTSVDLGAWVGFQMAARGAQ
jgi:hypothetical protein